MDSALLLEKANAFKQACYNCKNCSLCSSHGENYDPHVYAYGNVASPIFFIAEAPGKTEVELKKPLVGKSGQVYEEYILNELGLKRKEVWTTNIVLCRPPDNRKPTEKERQACLPHLKAQFELIKPELVVVLGATPLAAMLGIESGITKLAGQKLHSKTFDVDVFVLLHPSWFLRNHNFDLLKKHVELLKPIIANIINA